MPTATMERTQANAPAHSACYRAGVRIGAQEPRIRVENGSVAYTDGPDAAILISLSKIELFPWQKTVVDAWCSRDENDRPSYTTCGLSVSRQNGKNLIIEAFEIYKLAVDGAHILHTAHRVRTAKESFTRLVNHFNERVNPELAAMVEKIRYTNGEESITLKNGGRIEFSARSRAGTRGFADIQVVVFDEAQDLEDEQLARQCRANRIVVTDILDIAGVTAIAMVPNKYVLVGENVLNPTMFTAHDIYKNTDVYRFEAPVGGAIEGLKSTAVLLPAE